MLFGNTAKTTTSTTNNIDESIVDLSNSGGANFSRIGDINDSNVTVTDLGAVQAAFDGLDSSIDIIREDSRAALSAQSSSNRASLAAVTEFGRPDAGLTSNPVLLIVVAALGLGTIFMLRGKG